jgi:hypothetical protein
MIQYQKLKVRQKYKTKTDYFIIVERKTLNARNESENEDDDEPQLKVSKVN